MRRVYAIWVARALISPIFLKFYAITAMVFAMAQYVSFRSVFENAPAWHNVGAQYVFFSSAVTHTEAAVWGLSFLLLACLLWVGFDIRAKSAPFVQG